MSVRTCLLASSIWAQRCPSALLACSKRSFNGASSPSGSLKDFCMKRLYMLGELFGGRSSFVILSSVRAMPMI